MTNLLPAMPALPGDRGPILLGIGWAETFIATSFVAVRFYCRMVPVNSLGWDDYTILTALVCIYLHFDWKFTICALRGSLTPFTRSLPSLV